MGFLSRFLGKPDRAFQRLDEAESWLTQRKVDMSTVTFNLFEERGLARNIGAVVLVGGGQNTTGEHVSFVVEIKDSLVITGEFINPPGIASWSKSAARDAMQLRRPLIDVLQEMARLHREKYPDWRSAIQSVNKK